MREGERIASMEKATGRDRSGDELPEERAPYE
jgi:hypothetical protein